MCGSCCSGGSCAGCKTVGFVVLILVVLLAVASLVGVYVTHFTPVMQFGTAEGSLAIIAAVVALKVGKKLFHKMCPCGKKACGDGCNDACCGPKPGM